MIGGHTNGYSRSRDPVINIALDMKMKVDRLSRSKLRNLRWSKLQRIMDDGGSWQ